MTRLAPLALLALALAAPAPAPAQPQPQPFVDLAALDREVAQFAGADPGEPGGPLRPIDRRLHLARCAAPLALGWNGARHDAVLVRCPAPGGWHLYVPVQAQPAIQTIAIARGEAVTVTVEGDGFAVSQPGEALEAGASGEWIRVRTRAEAGGKGEPLRARIVRPGLVTVPLP